MEYYDKANDRINTRINTATNKLKRINRVYHTVTTTDDPVIRSLAKSEGNVFATDSIIATLMCCSRSVYPWDIVVSVYILFLLFFILILNLFLPIYLKKVENKIFLDRRDDSSFGNFKIYQIRLLNNLLIEYNCF